MYVMCVVFVCFFQAEDVIRDLVRSRGLGDVYKRQLVLNPLIFERSDDLISVTDRADVLTERKQKVIELDPN